MWIESCMKDQSKGQSDVCIFCVFTKHTHEIIVTLSQCFTWLKESSQGNIPNVMERVFLNVLDWIKQEGKKYIFHLRPAWILPVQVLKSNGSVSIRGLPASALDWGRLSTTTFKGDCPWTWAAASWAHYKETLQLIIFTLVADLSVQSHKWPGDFGEELNIWCNGCRKLKR